MARCQANERRMYVMDFVVACRSQGLGGRGNHRSSLSPVGQVHAYSGAFKQPATTVTGAMVMIGGDLIAMGSKGPSPRILTTS